jgi:Polyketide cyclase / dehydrase and lipid transport
MFDMVGLIDAPVARVWATFTDHPTWEIWFDGCKSCAATSTPASGVGSTRSITVSGLRVDERFIAWDHERVWAFTVVNLRPAFAKAMIERATFTDLGGTRTQIDYRIAISPSRWAGPLRKVFAKRMQSAFASSFKKLEAHILATE